MTFLPIPQVAPVDTSDPEREVWEYIGYFESESYASNFRDARISNPVITDLCNRLNTNKQNHNSIKSNSQLEPLKQVSASDKAVVREIANNARQARDFYTTAKSMPMLSKPIILHYAFEKLANILILNTYEITTSTYAHGLAFDPSTGNLQVMRKGLFARLHDCYSFDPALYANNYQFKLESIIKTEPIDESNLLNIGGYFGNVSVYEESTNSEIQMNEPDREFLFMFALSSLARYHVNIWSDIIEGKNSAIILRIRKYVQSCQRFFPNWILDALYWQHLMFFSGARIV